MKVVHTFYAADRQTGLMFSEKLAFVGGTASVNEDADSGEWQITLDHDVADGEALFALTEQLEALAAAASVDYDGHEVELN